MSATSTDGGPKAEYVNSFWSSRSLDPRVYRTDAKPVEYRGYLIYNRIKSSGHGGCWDVVTNGRCIGQYAGKSGAHGFVDKLHGEGDPEMVAFAQERLADQLAEMEKAA